MYASNLEELLYELTCEADAARSERADFTARFDSLRGYGRLPRGRANHATPLSDGHIANAILGLATDRPGWTGHVSLLLADLRPVGGRRASFGQVETLSDAVQLLITEKSARESFLSLVIASAESGTNANGHASLTYMDNGEPRTTHFVSKMALSLLGAGAEKTYRPEEHLALAPRQYVLSRRFFDRVARAVADARAFGHPPASDGSEYVAEEAEERRRKALGVRKGSYYLNMGVDNQVTWPKKETLITFDQYTMVLLPKTKENVQSISMDLTANKISMEEATTVMNRFLSVLAWCDDKFAVLQNGWAGNPIPVPVPRRDLAFTTTHHWVLDRQIPKTDEARRALAIYREARNAEQNFLVSYAVLSYYKIIELRHPDPGDATAWLKTNFPAASGDIPKDVLARFDAERGTVSPEDHINRAYRIAVAHATPKKTQPSDPDSLGEVRRLHTAADVLRPLARHFIRNELSVSDSRWSGD
jgi:hypothetical protein